MIFAKIDFINLLPFYVFIKKNITSSQVKQIIEYKKSYPSKINKKLKRKEIDAAFISSIASRKEKALDIGIVAKGEVLSVLALKGEYEEDYQSQTSNALAKVLMIEGKVIIGDKALFHYYNSSNRDFIDLAKEWKNRYNLPFVFALLCVNKELNYLKKISKKFLSEKIYLPQYILDKYSRKTGIEKKQIRYYLTKISYEVSQKEKRGLKLFLKLAKKKGI